MENFIFLDHSLLYGIGTLGLALTVRYLNFPDLTSLGSIMLGGIAGIWGTIKFGNSYYGLLFGILFGLLLGFITAVLISRKIHPILAGVISYTSSMTLAYHLAPKADIALLTSNVKVLFTSVFAWENVFIEIMFALSIVIVLSFLMITRFGLYVLAMSAHHSYIDNRHKYKRHVKCSILIISNSIIGLAGAMYAIRDSGASIVGAHVDFLPLAIAGIYAGNAITSFLISYIPSNFSIVANIKNSEGILATLASKIANISINNSHDSFFKLTILFSIYILSGTLFYELNSFIETSYSIPHNLRYIVLAISIVIFVLMSGSKETEKH